MVKRIRKDDALLALIDFQEKIMPAMSGKEKLEEAVVKLAKGCRALGIPALVTQQYTKGLGGTITSVAQALGAFDPIEKTSFSAMGAPEFAEAVGKFGRKTVIIAGIEAHVCVQQTVIDLIDSGYTVFVAADCVSSRSPEDRGMAKSRMRAEGAVYTTMEAVLFEICGDARQPGFQEISAIVK